MDKVTEGVLENNDCFKDWCDNLSSDILKEKIISKQTLSDIIYNKILSNEGYFYECLLTELEVKIDTIKTMSRRVFGKDNNEYARLSFVLSNLNNRQKKYNIERSKAFQKNNYSMICKFLKENGYEDIFKEFKSKRQQECSLSLNT